ncbi:hypothetical protein KSI01_27260 [Kurthia sibirica]|nr:hypothetical protein KSI01_27260 [Kurthia sibirica]
MKFFKKLGEYMTKEWSIKLFLQINKLLFLTFKLLPIRKKMTFICDFGDNARYTIKALNDKGFKNIIVLKTTKCQEDFSDLDVHEVLSFDYQDSYAYIKGIYHLATSSKVIVDNYFPILSTLPNNPRTECIQLWHAAGAIKKFALSDPSIAYRSPSAINRFRDVYERMDKIVVGSEAMSKVFRLAFHKAPDAFLRTGIPRTDFYFDEETIAATKRQFLESYPIIDGKKVVLYAPTFRDFELQQQKIPLNFKRIVQELGADYHILIKLHPAVAQSFTLIDDERITILENTVAIHEVLTVTDFLISDYSSIPYEFAFFNKPQIFYPYDIEQYAMSRGFWSDYASMVPGPVVDSDDELIHTILHLDFDLRIIEDFSEKWNTYSHGTSSQNLASYLLQKS